MDAEFRALIEQERLLLRHDTDEILKIPREALEEYASSIIPIAFAKMGSLDENDENVINAQERFNLLCQAAPSVPKKALESICLAHVFFEFSFGVGAYKDEDRTPVWIADNISSIAMARGFALGAAGADLQTFDESSKVMRHAMREAKTTLAKAAASARHAENYANKKKVFLWLDANFSICKSMNEAAQMMVDKELVDATFGTVRDWVADWKKQRSAGTP